MKKKYFFTLLLTLCFSTISFGQTPMITAIVDGDCSGGNPKLLEIYAKGTVDFTLYSLENQTNSNSTWGNTQDLSTLGTVTDGFVYISTSGSSAALDSDFPSISLVLESNTVNLNGDDRVRIILTSDSSVIDQYGVEATDGDGSTWEYKDSYAKRKDGTGPDAGFNEANWNFGGVSALNNLGVCQGGADTFETLIGGVGTYTATVSSDPTLSISSPSDGAVLDVTTSVDVKVSASNFVVGAVNGSGVDGHIHWTLQQNSDAAVDQPMKYDTNDESITVAPGNSYTIYMELVDNTHSAITPAVNETVTFSVAYSCDLVLESISTTCDAITSGTDTYSGAIAFTGGNSGTAYAITAPAGVTVGGDNPDTSASGTITFTGMTEGTDEIIIILGDATSSCDLYSNLVSPVCLSLPIADDFTYPDGSLIDNPLWVNNGGTMGDLMVISGQALIQHGTPSEDANLEFIPVAGNIYYALDFTVVDPGSPISGSDTEYFAHLKDTGFGLRARLDVVSPSAAGDFSVGISTKGSTADATWATDLFYGTSYRATVKYDQDNNIAQLWIDAAVEGDTSISGTDEADPGDSMVAFGLRQSDSELNEGVLVDNLMIATTFAATTLSIERNSIEGFATYPNPVTNNMFTITASSINKKELTIFNVLGKRVLSSSFSGVKSDVDVSTISAGIYILKVTEGGKTSTKKLVIR